jgi:hypothetical protein
VHVINVRDANQIIPVRAAGALEDAGTSAGDAAALEDAGTSAGDADSLTAAPIGSLAAAAGAEN